MADFAGAVAAMRARFVANFSSAPIAFQNEDPPTQPWPPVVVDPDDATKSRPTPWVYFEVIEADSNLRGAGLPGNNVWLTLGNIFVHVFTPEGYGLPESLRIAGLAGEVFRAATFYNDESGAKVVCMAPRIGGGASNADNGNWFEQTVSIPFEFYFIA